VWPCGAFNRLRQCPLHTIEQRWLQYTLQAVFSPTDMWKQYSLQNTLQAVIFPANLQFLFLLGHMGPTGCSYRTSRECVSVFKWEVVDIQTPDLSLRPFVYAGWYRGIQKSTTTREFLWLKWNCLLHTRLRKSTRLCRKFFKGNTSRVFPRPNEIGCGQGTTIFQGRGKATSNCWPVICWATWILDSYWQLSYRPD
jgi:hypothetical protein